MTVKEFGFGTRSAFTAGRKAFNLGVMLKENPYVKYVKYSQSWDKGYKLERNKFNAKKKETNYGI